MGCKRRAGAGRKETRIPLQRGTTLFLSISFCCVWATSVHFSFTLPPPFHSVLRPILNRYWAKHSDNKVSVSEHTSKTYLGNHALREKRKQIYGQSVGWIYIITMLACQPSMFTQRSIHHQKSSSDSPFQANTATPVGMGTNQLTPPSGSLLYQYHFLRSMWRGKGLQELCWTGNNSERAKSQNGTCGSEFGNKFKRFLFF